MTATALLKRRSSHGFDSGPDLDWRRFAACIDRWDEFTGYLPTQYDAQARAAHTCLKHCPVLSECKADTVAQRPIEVVQAGQVWRSRGPFTPSDPGCGPWCQSLRGVHRGH